MRPPPAGALTGVGRDEGHTGHETFESNLPAESVREHLVVATSEVDECAERPALLRHQLGQDLGMQVVNLSEEGMGYRVAPPSCSAKPCRPFSGLAARVAEAKPAAIVVVGGEADGDYALGPFVASTFTALKKAAPDAQVVALSPLSSRSARPHWLVMHARSIEKEAAAAGVTWVDVSAATGKPSAYDGGQLTTRAGAEVVRAIEASLQ